MGRGREEDHLINWELVSQVKEKGGLGRKSSKKNEALLEKWLWRFQEERHLYGLQSIEANMD